MSDFAKYCDPEFYRQCGDPRRHKGPSAESFIFCTVEEVAEILGVSRTTVYRWLNQKKFSRNLRSLFLFAREREIPSLGEHS